MEKNYSIKQVSEETGLSIHTLRYYEEIKLIVGIGRDKNGYRQYAESDIAWFQMIKYMREMGMPIKELQQVLALDGAEADSTNARLAFMQTYREKVVEQMKELEKTLEKIDHKIEFFKSLGKGENRIWKNKEDLKIR